MTDRTVSNPSPITNVSAGMLSRTAPPHASPFIFFAGLSAVLCT